MPVIQRICTPDSCCYSLHFFLVPTSMKMREESSLKEKKKVAVRQVGVRRNRDDGE